MALTSSSEGQFFPFLCYCYVLCCKVFGVAVALITPKSRMAKISIPGPVCRLFPMPCSALPKQHGSLFQRGRPLGICRNTAANHPACKADLWEANKLRWASWSDRTLPADRACSDLGEKGSSVCRWCTVTVSRAGRCSFFPSFFLVVGKEEDWRVFVSLQNIALRCLFVSSFSCEKRGTGEHFIYLATPGMRACAETLIY